jgi:lysophospholipase L1-like esterase
LADHPEYLSADGFHPSSDGYARLADVFAEAAGARS